MHIAAVCAGTAFKYKGRIMLKLISRSGEFHRAVDLVTDDMYNFGYDIDVKRID